MILSVISFVAIVSNLEVILEFNSQVYAVQYGGYGNETTETQALFVSVVTMTSFSQHSLFLPNFHSTDWSTNGFF